jgi:DNA invertase Pin-like site-specific DNA recombinase
LQQIRQQLRTVESPIANDAAGKRAANKPGRPRKSKRGKAKELTKQQDAVVAAIEDHKLSVAEIAKSRGCSDKAVYAIYKRAKENPAYKKHRSMNLGAAKPLHSNIQRKSDRDADE